MLKSLLTLLLFTLASASITPCYTVALDACNTKGTLQCEIVRLKYKERHGIMVAKAQIFVTFIKEI